MNNQNGQACILSLAICYAPSLNLMNKKEQKQLEDALTLLLAGTVNGVMCARPDLATEYAGPCAVLVAGLASLTPAQLSAGREWCVECADCGTFRDVDAEQVADRETVSDADIVAHVARNFEGGWSALIASL